jgi:hypothetical protein
VEGDGVADADPDFIPLGDRVAVGVQIDRVEQALDVRIRRGR